MQDEVARAPSCGFDGEGALLSDTSNREKRKMFCIVCFNIGMDTGLAHSLSSASSFLCYAPLS